MGQIQINEDACIRNWTDKSRLTRIRQIYNSHEVSEMDFETTVLCVKKCTQLIHTNLNQRLGSWDKESDWQRFMGHKFSRNKSSPVCVYMYMYTDSHAHTHTRTHTRTHAQTHTHTHRHTHTIKKNDTRSSAPYYYKPILLYIHTHTHIYTNSRAPYYGCCRVLQDVVVCCRALQGVARCCRVLRSVAVCCSVLQCVAGRCRMLQGVAGWYRALQGVSGLEQCVAVCCSVLQCITVPYIIAKEPYVAAKDP